MAKLMLTKYQPDPRHRVLITPRFVEGETGSPGRNPLPEWFHFTGFSHPDRTRHPEFLTLGFSHLNVLTCPLGELVKVQSLIQHLRA